MQQFCSKNMQDAIPGVKLLHVWGKTKPVDTNCVTRPLRLMLVLVLSYNVCANVLRLRTNVVVIFAPISRKMGCFLLFCKIEYFTPCFPHSWQCWIFCIIKLFHTKYSLKTTIALSLRKIVGKYSLASTIWGQIIPYPFYCNSICGGSGNGLYLYLICICFSEKSTRDQSREVYLLIDNILVKNDLLYETLLIKICFFMRLFS